MNTTAAGQHLFAGSSSRARSGSYGRSLSSAGNRADNRAEQRSSADVFRGATIFAQSGLSFRFDPLRLALDAVPSPVHCDRFQVEHQIVVGSFTYDQLSRRSARNGNQAVIAEDVLVDSSPVDSLFIPLRIDPLIGANGDHCAGLDSLGQGPGRRAGDDEFSRATAIHPDALLRVAPSLALDTALRLVELALKLDSLPRLCVTENAASAGAADHVAGLRRPIEILRLRGSRHKQHHG